MTAEPGLPRGTVTFLFTDIEGSTALWEGDRAAMQAAVARHYDLIGEAARTCGGHLFKRIGDAAQIAFATAGNALAAAAAAQRSLVAEPWPISSPLQVRMALHTGEATPDSSGDYNQVAALNRLSRLLALAHGGQILVTQTTQALAGRHLPAGISLRDLGEYRLRDLQQPERVWQVLAPGLRADFPEIRDTPEFDAHELAFALFVASASQTDPTHQVNMLEEALTHFRALGDKAWMGHTLSNLAMAMEETGESRQAIARAEEAVVQQNDAQNEWELSLAKMNLAELWRLNGNAAAAMRQFQEALRIAQHSKDLWHIANCLQSLAAIVSTGERARAAAQLLGAAARLRARYGAIRESELWDYEPELAGEIRDAVGAQIFTEEFTSGMDAPLDETVALALTLPMESLTPDSSPIPMGERSLDVETS